MARIILKLIFIYILLSIIAETNAHYDQENQLSRPHNQDEEEEISRGDQQLQRHCNQDFCDTIVTKCQSTNRCSCDIKKDAFCVKDCVNCLEEKFGKCCGCVGLCPQPAEDTHSSHVGDIPLEKTYDELFEVLTESDDIHGRWLVEHRSTNGELLLPENKLDSEWSKSAEDKHQHHEDQNDDSKQCTMAFINKYLNMIQCRRYCKSMGASRYRWFDDGCCECLGKHCSNYGSENPKCHILPFE